MKKTLILLSLLAASVASAETWSSEFDFVNASGTTVTGTNDVTATITTQAGTSPTFNASGWNVATNDRYSITFGDKALDLSEVGNSVTVTLTNVTINATQNNDYPVLFTIGDRVGSGVQSVKVLYNKANSNSQRQINGENSFSSGNHAYTGTTSIDVTTGEKYSNISLTITKTADASYSFSLTLGDTTVTSSIKNADFTQNSDDLYLGIGGRLDNNNNKSAMTFEGMTITVTPEPTTATLSLLALAGPCARRRRK